MVQGKPYQSIFFCQPTPPKADTATIIKEIVKKEKLEVGLDIKVVGKAGIKIGKILPGLKGKEDCGKEVFFIHTTRGNCNRKSIVYKGSCLTWRDNGKKSTCIARETIRAGYVRGRQHMETITDHCRPGNYALAA